MSALASDAKFVAKVIAYSALAGVALIVTFGPLIVFLRMQCG